MKFTKTQQQVYDDLLRLLAQRGRPWLLGWALGMIIRLSRDDPQVRREIARLAGHDQ